MVLEVNKDNAIEMIETALEARQCRTGIFQWPVRAPEAEFIRLIKSRSISRGSAFAANALFLLTSSVFADNTAWMFRRISELSAFEKYYWLFMPNLVVQKSPGEVEQAAREYIRPGYNGRSLLDWHHNAEIVYKRYSNDFRNFLKENNSDAPKALEALVGTGPKAQTADIRRYGPKLARLLLLWTDHYDIYKLDRINKVGIQVDFNILALAVQNGVIKLDGPTNKDIVIPILHELFTDIVREREWKAYDIAETLWWIGHKLCRNLRHDICPLAENCTLLISRRPMDDDGLVDPTDIGRRYYSLSSRIKAEKKQLEVLNGQQTMFPLADILN